MSFRGIYRLSTCRSLLPTTACNRSAALSLLPSPWIADTGGAPYAQVKSRGKKTKTVIKARDLPQGVLPALPPDPSDNGRTKNYPPVLQQHLNHVRKFKDCVVLTRIGDFYELYFDQVDQYAHLINLKKAKRKTSLGDVAMAGFQHWNLDKYVKMLVQDLGLKVAIAEQVKLPESERSGNNQYDRKVTRVITAGTLVDESFLDPYESNYLLSVHIEGALPMETKPAEVSKSYERYKRTTKVGLTWVDLSSGDFFAQTTDLSSLPSVIARIRPRELVLDTSMESVELATLQRYIGEGSHSIQFHNVTQPASTVSGWTSMLERAIPEKQHSTFTAQELAAGNIVLDYIRDKFRNTALKLQPPVRQSNDEYMTIDKQSLRGLEIRSTLRDGVFKGSLLHVIRRTVTQSGARLLSQRLVSPSLSLSVINNRLDLVQETLSHDALREDVVALLKRTSDTLRLLQRFSIGKGDADDLLGLARTIAIFGQMSVVLHDHILATQNAEDGEASESGFLWDFLGRLDLEGPAKLAKTILAAIDEEQLTRQHTVAEERREAIEDMTDEVVEADSSGESAPQLARRTSKSSAESSDEDIWIMRAEASPILKRAHEDLERLSEARQQLASKMRQQLGAQSLTLKWSPRLGHHCHLKNKDAKRSTSAIDGARDISSTKTTRTFYLADWTSLGIRIDEAKLRIRIEEDHVLNKLRLKVIENLMVLRRNAAVLDELDVACSSAVVAKERNLVRPIMTNGTSHNIVGGRHPTVDVGLREQGRQFTSNDCTVGDRQSIYLITGPNMGGKSTYLRQNALITILAQIGSFVPAHYAEIGLVDKVFSRVGSADNLYQDQSTFMVEMLETAEILKQATARSFVIMDEVGRGTTPEDGTAVGYACLHHLHQINKCRTLFATHFHILANMTRDFERLAYYCTDVAEEQDGSWSFAHRIKSGVNKDSHALKVARMAGMPEQAIATAGEVLANLQHRANTDSNSKEQQLPAAMAAAG